MFQFIGQAADVLFQMSVFKAGPNLVIAVTVERIQVHPKRPREKYRVLRQLNADICS